MLCRLWQTNPDLRALTPRSKLRGVFLVPLVLLLLHGSNLTIAEDLMASALLGKMSHSHRELNYQGVFSFQQGDKMESLRITHAVINQQEYERLEYMDGDKREVIRRGHNLNCIHPGHRLAGLYQLQQQQNLKQSPGDHRDIADVYQYTVTGNDRVAGREVINVDVRPKDTHRFGYRLSLDKETGLLLRSELKGPKGMVLERFQYVELTIGEPIAIEHFAGADYSHQAMHIDTRLYSNELKLHSDRWMVNWLPGGFTSVVENEGFSNDNVAAFTDGLAVFSVFLERNNDHKAISKGVDGSAQQGATAAYSKALSSVDQNYRVTVVGEIPIQTAQQIAQSVSLANQ